MRGHGPCDSSTGLGAIHGVPCGLKHGLVRRMGSSPRVVSPTRYTSGERVGGKGWPLRKRWPSRKVGVDPAKPFRSQRELAGPVGVCPWLHFGEPDQVDGDYIERLERGMFTAFCRLATVASLETADRRINPRTGLWSR
jgi:hypothetical protein